MSTSRDLLQQITTIETTARDELHRADIKATILLTLASGGLAGVIALTGRPVPAIAAAMVWTAATGLGAVVLLLLGAIRPNLGSSTRRNAGVAAPIGSWLHAATAGPGALRDALIDRSGLAREFDHAEETCVLARITTDKFRAIRRAVTLLAASLAVLAVGGFLALITAVTR